MLIRFMPIPLLAMLLISAVALCTTTRAQDGAGPARNVNVESAREAAAKERTPYRDVKPEEQRIIEAMLTSPDWAYRTLAIMRLARYEGDAVREAILARLTDQSWQVRCFAIRHAWMHSYEIDPSLFSSEDDARVFRALVQHDVPVNSAHVQRATLELLRSRTVDGVLLGIELAAAIDDDDIRRNASRRTLTLVENMNPQLAAVVSRRLARVLQVAPPPQTVLEWRQWLADKNTMWMLPKSSPPVEALTADSPIADADWETFARLRDYMSMLRQRDLELVIALDSTNSMGPMIDAVKADVDALILFMSDISSTLRLGILAYRDHDNPGKLIEAHPFSTNLESLRNFLFGLQTPGGATYPEAVLAGLDACRRYEWSPRATREIILIGDAPPHEQEESELRRLLDFYREQGFTIHTVHVPMVWPRGYLESMPAPQAHERENFRIEYNIATEGVFQQIANFGGGKSVQLRSDNTQQLVRQIMKLTLERDWWPYFDEFYERYLELCR